MHSAHLKQCSGQIPRCLSVHTDEACLQRALCAVCSSRTALCSLHNMGGHCKMHSRHSALHPVCRMLCVGRTVQRPQCSNQPLS